MPKETLQKVIETAEKSPKGLMGLRWYLLTCNNLDIVAKPAEEQVVFSAHGKNAIVNLITEENAQKFKCQVKPGSESILIYEFMRALVGLLTDKEIPAKEFARLGEEAEYYVSEAVKILKPIAEKEAIS